MLDRQLRLLCRSPFQVPLLDLLSLKAYWHTPRVESPIAAVVVVVVLLLLLMDALARELLSEGKSKLLV